MSERRGDALADVERRRFLIGGVGLLAAVATPVAKARDAEVICVGMLANTCIEATARIGMELGFHVTLIRDATAARSREALHAAHDVNGPTYAHEILTTAELVKALKQG